MTLAATPDYATALEFLTSRINYERSAVPYHAQALRLDRMREFLERLGGPHERLNIVHVAGTKGKGSVAAMTAAMLGAAGYRAGLNTSPHLEQLEERIVVDGLPCSSMELAELVALVRPVVEELDRRAAARVPAESGPTYFDITTALALVHFARRGVDAAVLEVGLGGRLDSTNVCRPLVSVITSISFDHTEQLGTTLARIAAEKAGIIKPGVPVVCGATADEARQVIEEVARRQQSPFYQLGRDFAVEYLPPPAADASSAGAAWHAPARLHYREETPAGPWSLADVEMGMLGSHQAANAAVALAAARRLAPLGWRIDEPAARRGLATARCPARVEVLGHHPTVVLDAAHNVASVEALVRTLEESFLARPRLLVFAASRDKDIPGMLDRLLPRFDDVVFTRYVKNPRACEPAALAEIARNAAAKPRIHLAADPAGAWRRARQIAGPGHLVCIAGSFFLAAEMRGMVRGTPQATQSAVA